MREMQKIAIHLTNEIELAKLNSGKIRNKATGSQKMKKKIKAKARARAHAHKRARSVTRLKPRRSKAARKARKSQKPARTAAGPRKVVRIMGHGQFTVDSKTLKKLNEIDNALVEMVATQRADDGEFKKLLAELNHVTIKHGKAVEPSEIVRSDIILPSADLPVDEAKKLFVGDGVIPS